MSATDAVVSRVESIYTSLRMKLRLGKQTNTDQKVFGSKSTRAHARNRDRSFIIRMDHGVWRESGKRNGEQLNVVAN
jgi:hypothetical protein